MLPRQALRRGFHFLPDWTHVLARCTTPQRRRLVSGIEVLSADVVWRRVVPIGWPQDHNDHNGRHNGHEPGGQTGLCAEADGGTGWALDDE